MKAVEQAIREAEKSGYEVGSVAIGFFWNVVGTYARTITEGADGLKVRVSAILLDSSFWQALSKAKGWNKIGKEVPNLVGDWQYHWHRFIAHLAEGKDAESFFAELLTV
jgi:hypothetical protein